MTGEPFKKGDDGISGESLHQKGERMKLRPAEKADLSFVRRLYKEAFPRSERKPFSMIRRETARGRMELLVLLENEVPAGLAVTAVCAEPILIDYFAIDETMRGRGLGTAALAAIRSYYGEKTLFLEIEAPDPAAPNHIQRVARKRFYERSGFLDTGYRVQLMGIPMELLSTDTVMLEECHRAYRALYREWCDRLIQFNDMHDN